MRKNITTNITFTIFAVIAAFAVLPAISSAMVSSVTTLPANPVSSDSAVLHGTVVENSSNGTCAWFEYGTNGFFYDSTQKECGILNYTSFNFNGGEAIYNLQANTTYNFRVVAQDYMGSTTRGFVQQFTTASAQTYDSNFYNTGSSYVPNGVPAVTTNSAYGVNSYSASLDAFVTPNGVNTTAWFEYASGQSGWDLVNGDLGTKVGEQYISSSGASQVDVNYSLTNLQPDTLYYYRAVAKNNNGTTEGSAIMSFKTTSADTGISTSQPAVSTNAAMFVRETSAILNGTVNPNNVATSAWFEWSTDPNLSNANKSIPETIGSDNTDKYMAYALSNLTLGQTYYFRVVAQNIRGTTYGTINHFTTHIVPTSAIIQAAPKASNTSTSTSAKQAALTDNLLTLEAEFDNNYPRPGKEIIYAISYKNNSDIALDNAVLNITIPNETVFKNSSFTDINQDVNAISFKLGSIAPKGSGLVSIKVKINGATKVESLKFTTSAAYSFNGKHGNDELISELKLNYTSLTASVIDTLGNVLNNALVDLLTGGLLGFGIYHFFVMKKKVSDLDADDPLK